MRACVRACMRACVCLRKLVLMGYVLQFGETAHKEYIIIVQVSDVVSLVVRDVCRTIYRSFIRRKVTFLLNI